MGSASSKFKKYLQHGDEFAAMQVFQSGGELRKLDPNLSYGDGHQHNTAMHYACRHGMKHLLRTFLVDLGGNPNKKNGHNETSLHAACLLAQPKMYSAQERRAACVTLILQWRGVPLNTGQRERIDMQAQDQHGNTALHCAAASGLKRCVELLLSNGSPLFLENHDKLTPCDMAMRNNHHDIAQLLESRMVFDDSSDTVNEAVLYGEQEEVYSGLRTQDLQEAKDQLLVETSDMLHIPLFTAEALLRDNEWSRESLLEKWMKDPVQCCQLAGVQPPSSALQQCGGSGGCDPDTGGDYEPLAAGNAQHVKQFAEVVCDICTLSMPCWDLPVLMSCHHRFCTPCWESYLTVKIQDGDAHHILCPAYQCHILVPVEVIERLVSPDVARRYLQFDIKAFVESNRSIKWCPMPGCGRAVRLPENEQAQPSVVFHSLPTSKPPPMTSHAVDCGNGHFFCWECLGVAHAPSGCDQWVRWQGKIAEVRPEELRASGTETEDAANCLWLVTNSKPCPNCKSPIQKNEGCNHMKCSKCKYDFCWVCLENWKKHSSATGGYFRCNRFEAVHKADEKQGVLINEAVLRNVQMQELNRFLHYYTRFRNHENSEKMEEPLLGHVRQKVQLLAAWLQGQGNQGEGEAGDKGMQFVEEGVRELLKARRVLCGSYVYGYYLEDNGYNKTIFEFMQNELEEVTEKLSEMVARPYLRTPRSVIIQTTTLARRKRHEFVRAVGKGLIPPETPPTLRKIRKRRFPGLLAMDHVDDEQMSHAIAASLKDLDPDNPWVKDPQGRHTNLAAMYDWAEAAGAGGDEGEGAEGNVRTHDVCGVRCGRYGTLAEEGVYHGGVSADYNMDLVIALEMSRLQMIEDEMKKCQRAQRNEKQAEQPPANPGTSVANPTGLDEQQMKMAIQLSLQETTKLASKLHNANAMHNAANAMHNANTTNNANTTSGSEGSTNAAMQGDDRHGSYHKTNADLTVDYFLKSLAGRQIDLKNFSSGMNVFSPEDECELVWGCGINKKLNDKELLGGFKAACGAEDGRFQIGDLHESGCYFDAEDFDDLDARLLKRSHSTGDLCTRGRRPRGAGGPGGNSGDEPRYHLDSDHSGHEDRPEEVVKRMLAGRGGVGLTGRQFLLFSHPAGGGEISTANSEDTSFYYGGQSSVEDTTTTSDSLNADLEVCGILGTTEDEAIIIDDDLRSVVMLPEPVAVATAEASEAGRKVPVVSLLEAHRKAFKAAGGKATGTSGLRIRICKSPSAVNAKDPGRVLETDSSNEYESETGIPRSPTLFISGVSISRTPEPRSPALAAAVAAAAAGRQSRSSSLTVPPPLGNANAAPLGSSNSLNASACVSPCATPVLSGSCLALNVATPPPLSAPSSPDPHPPGSKAATPHKAKSASEPEREREMFRFPKSSTDGALSSVLHVQESNLSSDDFHEALFLLERSPKGSGSGSGSAGSSKRRKKSKKERDKDKENSNAVGGTSKIKEVQEASSAL